MPSLSLYDNPERILFRKAADILQIFCPVNNKIPFDNVTPLYLPDNLYSEKVLKKIKKYKTFFKPILSF